MKYFILCAAFILLYSCDTSADSKKDYREGEIILGFDDLITEDTMFAVANYYNHKILNSSAFPHKVGLPADSLSNFTNLLQSKSYLLFYGFLPAYDTSRASIVFYPYFVDVDTYDQLDWKRMSDSLLFDTLNVYHPKYALIQVPVGKERYWISIYENRPHVTYAELNGINALPD